MTPRPRSFDEATALRSAKELFWTQGFEATSMQNLVDAMQIGRQSLYNTFGDKRTLFLKTLELYDNDVQNSTLRELNSADAGLPEVESFLRNVADALTSQDVRRSCFLMNSILELSNTNESVREMAEEFRKNLIASLESAMTRALANGQLDSPADVHTSALKVANTAMGLSLTWKSGASKDEMDTIVEGCLSHLKRCLATSGAN